MSAATNLPAIGEPLLPDGVGEDIQDWWWCRLTPAQRATPGLREGVARNPDLVRRWRRGGGECLHGTPAVRVRGFGGLVQALMGGPVVARTADGRFVIVDVQAAP